MTDNLFDIRRRNETANHEYYDRIFEAIPNPIIVVNRSATIVTKNQSGRILFHENNSDQIEDDFIVVDTGETLKDFTKSFIFDSGFAPTSADVIYRTIENNVLTHFKLRSFHFLRR